MTDGGPVTPPGVALSGGTVIARCTRCNDSRSYGELGSDGWFVCRAGHKWELKCPARSCGKTVKLRQGRLICARKHVLDLR